jgi:sulfate adenylyltransferase
MMNHELIAPYKGEIINLTISGKEREALLRRALTFPKIQLSFRNVCDLELLATGAFSPLNQFLGKEDYTRVLEEMRSSDGTLFPIPITLSVNRSPEIKLDSEITLIDQYNNILALMRVDEVYEWDVEKEAKSVCGTTDLRHPLVAEMQSWGKCNIAGKLTVLNLPTYYDFKKYRLTPLQTRERLKSLGNKNVVAFQTRNPLHRAHEELTKRAAEMVGGTLLLHPVVGMTQAGDIDYFVRVRTYQTLIEKYYDERKSLLSLLPLAMRMAGPREAIWHAIIRRNFGANYMIVGRHHASPSIGDFYGEYDAHEAMQQHEEEIGVRPLLFSEYVYLQDENRYEEANKIEEGKSYLQLSGSFLRELLNEGKEIPEWFQCSEVAEILKEAYPPLHKKGFCVWFTGLSGAGKSTIAQVLITKLLEHGRRVTLLDGDNVRINLSKGLGFSKEDRDTNIRRIGFVASEIVKHGGAVVCAAISPYRNIRNECRTMIGSETFIEVFVDTPLDVCESRDMKGLYSLARQGKLTNFTGINDPYEKPVNPEIRIETVNSTPEESADVILDFLKTKGFIQT